MSDSNCAVDKSLDRYIDDVLDEVAAELKRTGAADRPIPGTPEARDALEHMRDGGVTPLEAAVSIMAEFLGVE